MIASFPRTEKHFAKFPNIIVLILLFAAATIPHATGAVVTADGFQLKLNGQPFVIKGMNYSPVPIGAAPRYVLDGCANCGNPKRYPAGDPSGQKGAPRAA
jgi:hypothetical protein